MSAGRFDGGAIYCLSRGSKRRMMSTEQELNSHRSISLFVNRISAPPVFNSKSLVIPEVGVGADLGFMFAGRVSIAPRLLSEVVIEILNINNLVKNA